MVCCSDVLSLADEGSRFWLSDVAMLALYLYYKSNRSVEQSDGTTLKGGKGLFAYLSVRV